MPLYHYQIGFPKDLEIKPEFGLKYSTHAKMEMLRDRNGTIERVPKNFIPRTDKVIEVETDSLHRPTKIVFRHHYDGIFDVVVVMQLPDKVVRTVWLNSRSDHHRTLDRSHYDKP